MFPKIVSGRLIAVLFRDRGGALVLYLYLVLDLDRVLAHIRLRSRGGELALVHITRHSQIACLRRITVAVSRVFWSRHVRECAIKFMINCLERAIFDAA
ncbi:MAG TPA: hypothetical protein PLW12_09285, partial [Methanothrix sp.]|nr:hypothetical protein [Methanothrix sp.]